jgi:hypothetical protein
MCHGLLTPAAEQSIIAFRVIHKLGTTPEQRPRQVHFTVKETVLPGLEAQRDSLAPLLFLLPFIPSPSFAKLPSDWAAIRIVAMLVFLIPTNKSTSFDSNHDYSLQAITSNRANAIPSLLGHVRFRLSFSEYASTKPQRGNSSRGPSLGIVLSLFFVTLQLRQSPRVVPIKV